LVAKSLLSAKSVPVGVPFARHPSRAERLVLHDVVVALRCCSVAALASSTTSGGAEIKLEQVRAVEAPCVTYVKYR
jgi:hypothetical protein